MHHRLLATYPACISNISETTELNQCTEPWKISKFLHMGYSDGRIYE